MSDQQSISVLPQTGHGRFAVRDALFIEEAKLFISLDEAGALILWDYSTSQQLAALSFPAGKPKPGKLRYEEETLYAFGSLAIYRWALEELRACKQKTGTQPAQPWIDFTLEERFANIEDRLVDGNLSAGRRFYSFRVNSFQSSFSIDQDFYLYNLEMGQAAPSGGLAMHFKNDELLAIANSDLSSFTIVIQGHSYHEQTQLLALVLDLGEIDVGWGGHVVKLTTRERRVLLLDPAKDLSNGVKKNEIMADVSFFQSIGHLIWRFNLEDNCLFWQENSAGFPLMKMSLDVQAAPESIALPQPAKSFRAGPIIDEEQYGIFNGNKGLEIHNLSQNKEVASFPGERHLLHFEANGQLIASAGPAQPLNLWNWKTQTLRRSFFADIPKVKSCYGLEDGGIRFVFNNNSIYTLRIEEGFQLSHQLDWDQPMGHAVFSPDGRYAAIVNAHAPHELFLLEGEKQIRKIPAAEASELLYAEQITFSPDSQWMAYLLQDEKKNCTLLDIYQLEDIISQEEMNFNLFLRQQSSKKSIRINLNSTKEPALHEGLPPRSHHLAFHPTSPLLAVCFEDEEARNNLLLYDCQQVASGTPFTAVGEKVTLADNGEEPLQIHFDKSGQFLTFRGMGRAEILEVLDIETGTFRPLFSPTAPSNPQKVRKGWLNEFAPSANTPLLFNFNGEQHIALEQAEKKLLFGKLSGLIEYFETAPANRRPLEEEASFLQLDVSNAPYDGLCIMENLPLVFFTSLDQEAIYLANWKTRQVAGKLYLSGENKFLLFDEDSYSYYTTAESLGMIAFQQGEELFPMDQFDLILNRPHRLLDKMGVFPAPSLLVGKFEQAFNRRLEKAFEGHDDSLREKILTRINTKVLEEIDNRGVAALPDVFEALNLPSITYQLPDSQNGVTDQAELSFKFAVSGNGEKLARMNIHVNGVPANGEMDIVEMLQVSKKTFGGRQGIIPAFSMQGHFTSTIHLQLSKGMNEVQLSALNQIGGEALRKTFYIRYENKQSPPVKPRLYFIGIGVGEHELGPRLNFPKPDIEKLAAALQAWLLKDEANPGLSSIQSKAPFNEPEAFQKLEELLRRFREEQLQRPEATFRELIIRTIFDRKATKAGMEAFLQKVKEELLTSDVDDRIMLYYSSHGVRNEKEELILSTHDMDFEDFSNGLPYHLLEDLLDGIPARNKLIVLDACASGKLDRSRLQMIGQNTIDQLSERDEASALFSLLQGSFVELDRGVGATIFAGAQGFQEAFESEETQSSVLSRCLFEKLADFSGSRQQLLLSGLLQSLVSEVPKFMMAALLLQKLPQLEGREEKVQEAAKAMLAEKILGLPQKILEEKLAVLLKKHLSGLLEQPEEAEALADVISKKLQQPTFRARNTVADWEIW